MRRGSRLALLAAAVVAISGVAVAADNFGIPTYPGAKTDADTQAICAQPQLSLVKQRGGKGRASPYAALLQDERLTE